MNVYEILPRKYVLNPTQLRVDYPEVFADMTDEEIIASDATLEDTTAAEVEEVGTRVALVINS